MDKVEAAVETAVGASTALGEACVSLAAELSRISLGRSQVAPERGDWRFKDPTWQQNLFFKRLAQTYLASCQAVDSFVGGLQQRGIPGAEGARFAATILTSAAAPTNVLPLNPAALKKTLETGGANLVRGGSNFASDLVGNRGMPSMSKRGALKVGIDMALTEGAVVSRDNHAEVLQFRPTTETVYDQPVLLVPPPIGRYYYMDMSPGRSMIEYALSQGLQTFTLSWRNPTRGDAQWSLNNYITRVRKAIDEVREITGSDGVHLMGFCAGGMFAALTLNDLAADGDPAVTSAAVAVTLLDFSTQAPISAFKSSRLLSLAKWNSSRRGMISARDMGTVFTWMKPNDLVWNYWVNNYLMGEDPPVFDILAWNADGTNLPACFHGELLRIFDRNAIATPGTLEVLDKPVDLGSVKVPTLVVGALNDHITPWRGTYRTTQLLGGETEFALSNAGHVAALVNPPGNPKASYYVGQRAAEVEADAWLENAHQRTGSWWEHWTEWVASHSSSRVPAPERLGSDEHPVLDDAPGRYVRDLLPEMDVPAEAV